MLTIKPDPHAPSDMDKAASTMVQENSEDVVASVVAALEDDEMRKAKRVRSVFKVVEKLLPIVTPSSASEDLAHGLAKVAKLLNGFFDDTESKPVQSICNKLKTEIDAKVSELSQRKKVEEPPAEQNKGDSGGAKAPKSKKKKKKKK